MDINFKLIPYQSDPNFIYTIHFENNNIIFKDIIKNFLHKGFLLKYLNDVKFISFGKQFNVMEEKLNSNNTNFYLFTNSEVVKQNLKESLYKNISDNIIDEHPLEDIVEISINDIEHDDINSINDEIKESLTPQLLNLLNVCVQNPELLSKVNSYLQSGNIEEPIELNNIDEEQFSYNDEFKYINTYFCQYGWDHKLIKNVLNQYKGHLNLSIRYLINTVILSKQNTF